jgi:hypothetical protein
MHRRTFLAAGSLGAAAALAGCGGIFGDADGNESERSSEAAADGETATETATPDPAAFSNVSLGGPANASVGEAVSIPVSVTNTGEQSGTFEAALSISNGTGTRNESLTIEGIAPGATRGTEVGPLNATAAGEYTLAVEGHGATRTLPVGPARLGAGELFALGNGLRVAIRGIAFEPTLFYTTDGAASPPNGNASSNGTTDPSATAAPTTTAVPSATAPRNATTVPVVTAGGSPGGNASSATATPNATIGGTATANGTAVGNGTAAPNATATPNGSTALIGPPTASGQTRLLDAGTDGVFAIVRLAVENAGDEPATFEADRLELRDGRFRSQLAEGAPLHTLAGVEGGPLTTVGLEPGGARTGWLLARLPRSSATNPVGITAQRDGGGPPDARWVLPPEGGTTRPLARFALESLSVPERAEIGRVPLGITVRNEGKAAGTFRGLLQRRSGGGAWRTIRVLADGIGAGATARFEPALEREFLGSATYRVRPFDAERTVAFTPARQAFGEPYTTPDGIAITVGELVTARSATTRRNGQTTVTDSPEGRQFVFVRVETEVLADRATDTGYADAFAAVAGSESYGRTALTEGEGTIRSPVRGPRYADLGERGGGSFTAGWMVFSVPATLSTNELSVRWAERYDAGWAVAEWSVAPEANVPDPPTTAGSANGTAANATGENGG